MSDDATREESALHEAYDALFATTEAGPKSLFADDGVKQAFVGVAQALLHAKEHHDVNEIYSSGRQATNGLMRALTIAATANGTTVEVTARYRQHARGLNAAFAQLERAHADAELRHDNVSVIKALQEAICVLTSVLNAVALGQDIPADTMRVIDAVEQNVERMIGVKLDVLELNPNAQPSAGSPASVQAFVAARRDFPLSPTVSTPASAMGASSRRYFPAAEDSIPTAETPIGAPPTSSTTAYTYASVGRADAEEDELREGTLLTLQPEPPSKYDDEDKKPRKESERESERNRMRKQHKPRTFHGAPNHPPSPPHSDPSPEAVSEHTSDEDHAEEKRPREPSRQPSVARRAPTAAEIEAEYQTVVTALGRNFPYLHHLRPGHLHLRTDATGRRFVRIDVIEFDNPLVATHVNERGELVMVPVEEWEEFYVDGGPGPPPGARKKIRCCVM